MKKLISLALAVLILAFSFASCGTHPAATALDKCLSYIETGDFANASVLENRAFSDEDDEMLKAMYAHFEYKIGEAAETESGASVTVTITMTDVGTVFSNYMTEALKHMLDSDWDSDGAVFEQMLSADDAPLTTNTVKVAMVEKEGEWIVADENNDLLNAITGGLFSALNNLGDLFN